MLAIGTELTGLWNTHNDDAKQHGAVALDQAVASVFASDRI